VIGKMLPPNNIPLGRLAKEEGISVATLAKWRAEARARGQFLPDAKASPEGWSSECKCWIKFPRKCWRKIPHLAGLAISRACDGRLRFSVADRGVWVAVVE